MGWFLKFSQPEILIGIGGGPRPEEGVGLRCGFGSEEQEAWPPGSPCAGGKGEGQCGTQKNIFHFYDHGPC